MGITSGGRRGGAIGEINMTPMIDVLLVLLIIFMVVQQGLQRGIGLQVPPPRDAQLPAPVDDGDLVLEVQPGGRALLNRQPIPSGELEAFLTEVFAPRPRKVLFVKGAESVPYGDVIRAVDASRAAGVQVVGLVPLTP
jgi:biopolymer transport protein TolR